MTSPVAQSTLFKTTSSAMARSSGCVIFFRGLGSLRVYQVWVSGISFFLWEEYFS